MFMNFYCHDWCLCTCMVIASVVFAQHSSCFVLTLKDQKRSVRLRPIHPSQWVRQNTGVNQERLLNRSGHVRSSKTRYRKGNSPADGSQAPRPTAWKDTFVSFEWFVDIVMSPLPDCLQEYRTAQLTDTDCTQLIHLCHNVCLKHKCHVPENVQQYWSVCVELAPHEDLLLCGHWIVVSRSLQKETLQKIHRGHQGITKCSLRATSSVWWPGVKQQLENLILSRVLQGSAGTQTNCVHCISLNSFTSFTACIAFCVCIYTLWLHPFSQFYYC